MPIDALLLTLLSGIFFIVGISISKLFSKKKQLLTYTTSIAFIIMIFLLIKDLLPETIEIFPLKEYKNLFFLLFFILLGFALLKGLDTFVPEHHHDHKEQKDDIEEHNNHNFHIGFITALSLIIHNILEGISIYIAGINDFKIGFVMALTVGCHNLPLGMEIAASMQETNKKNSSKYIIFSLLVLSSFLGAFLLYILKQELNEWVEGMLLSLTIGMLIYISFKELLPEIKGNWQ